MRQLFWIPICLVALLVPTVVLAGRSQDGFDGVVSSLESRYHAHATRIPLLGLITFVARRAARQDVSNLHVAEFEDFSQKVDGDELNRMVDEKIGSRWQRIVRETSRSGGEETLIYMRPEGRRMGIFVVDVDGHEIDVVQVSVDPDHLNGKLDLYEHHGHRNDISD